MKIKELIEEFEFKEVRDEVNVFVRDMLKDYLEDLYIAEDKQIFDFVWGSVEFNSGEIAILDSPLLQRLRKIKHLGLAGYVYCNADYSRFSHTIGVFFIANKMANIIRKCDKNERTEFDFVQITKLAALFHDVGHMYFSHVSEYYFAEDITFSRHETIKEIIVRFSEVANKKVALHEIISILIVNSPDVKELLKKVTNSLEGIKIKNERDYEKLIEYISCLIIGIANDAFLLPYHQIINGSVDADKCDYLSRDSHSTNVPVAVDIDRLIHKLSVVRVHEHGQENEIWADCNRCGVFYIPVVKSSAEEALNQLLMSRTIMFKSVYYHQKVRTAETMLKKLISDMNGVGIEETSNFSKILWTTDDFFGMKCFSILKTENTLNAKKEKELLEITKKLEKLNYRFLLKRVCAISKENIILEDDKWFAFSKKIFQLSNPEGMKEIEERTAEEYAKVCKLLDFKTTGNELFIISEFPKYSPDNSKIDTKISYGNGEIRKASEVFQSETWMGSKESRNKEHYLLTDSKYRGIAFLALQKALYYLHEVKLKDSASAYSKVSINDLRKDQKTLLYKHYYNDSMNLVSEILLEEFQDRIKKLNKKFQTFEGKKGSIISETKIDEYLVQFLRCKMEKAEEGKLLIDGIIKLLEDSRFINRREFDQGMAKLLSKLDQNRKTIICPLGGEKDSAKHMMYYFNDILKEYKNIETKQSLQECLKDECENILFFDDGAYSGKQVISIFQEYFGVDDRTTNETHVKMLEENERKILQGKRLLLAYICFNPQKKDYILKELEKLGLSNVDIEFIFDMGTKSFERVDLFDSEQQQQLVLAKLQEIGYALLKTTKCVNGEYKQNWDENRISLSAMGYNDSQQVIILKSSVPTYTITAFWMENGIYNNQKWIPLFERTDK